MIRKSKAKKTKKQKQTKTKTETKRVKRSAPRADSPAFVSIFVFVLIYVAFSKYIFVIETPPTPHRILAEIPQKPCRGKNDFLSIQTVDYFICSFCVNFETAKSDRG